MTDAPLPKPISVNNLFVNTVKGRRPSRRYKAWKAEADAMVLASGPRICIREPVHIEITIGRKGVRADADIDNMSKAYLDCLTRCGVIADDDIRIVQSLHLRMAEGFEGAVARIVKQDVA